MGVYSSGSVEAQRLLLGCTDAGRAGGGRGEGADLTGWVSAWWDTRNAGGKIDEGSYRVVARGMGVETREMVFFSDGVAGMVVCLFVWLSVCRSLRHSSSSIVDAFLPLPIPHMDALTRKEGRGREGGREGELFFPL